MGDGAKRSRGAVNASGEVGVRVECRELGFGEELGGEAGIRTLGRGLSPYNGLANRRLQPLGHLTASELPAFLKIIQELLG